MVTSGDEWKLSRCFLERLISSQTPSAWRNLSAVEVEPDLNRNIVGTNNATNHLVPIAVLYCIIICRRGETTGLMTIC